MVRLQQPICNYASGNYTGESISGLTLTTSQILQYYGKITKLSAMSTVRQYAATFTIGGKGYIVGGYNGGYLTTAECYDPVTDTWSMTASMFFSKHSSTGCATDEKGYIFGGDEGNECYDPVTNSWSLLINPPQNIRYTYSFSIGGKVYLCGGYNGGGLTVVQCYDPGTSSWTYVADTPIPCSAYFNGATVCSLGTKGYIVYGWNTLCYDTIANTWSILAGSPENDSFAIFAMNNHIYMCGRALVNGDNLYEFSIYRYDPATNSWLYIINPLLELYMSPVFVIGNKAYICGEYETKYTYSFEDVLVSETPNIYYTLDGTTPTETSLLYTSPLTIPNSTILKAACIDKGHAPYIDKGYVYTFTFGRKLYPPICNIDSTRYTQTSLSNITLQSTEFGKKIVESFGSKANMNIGRYMHTTFVIDGKGYVAGGYRGYSAGGDTNSVECYDPVTDTWSIKASMNSTRSENPGAFSINGKGYVCGGYGPSSYLDTVEMYNPSTNIWTYVASLPYKIGDIDASFAINGKGYICGGYTVGSGYTTATYCYDPSLNTWVAKASYTIVGRSSISFVLNNKAYICGGLINGTHVECYDPTTDTWSIKTSMSKSRANSAGFAINGKGYIYGGYYNTSADKYNNIEIYNDSTNTWEFKVLSGAVDYTQCKGFAIDNMGYISGGLNSDTYAGHTAVRAYGFTSARVPVEIRYTLDGTTPTLTSPLYSEALSVSIPKTLKAACFFTGYTTSDTLIREYLNYIKQYPYFWLEPPTFNIESGTSLTENFLNDVVITPGKVANYPRGYIDSLSQLNSLAAPEGKDAFAFVVNNTAYITGTYFQKYNKASDMWTQLSGEGSKGPAFVINNIAYRCSPISNMNKIQKLDTATNTWSNVCDLPYSGYGATAFVLNNKGYICGGATTDTYNKFQVFNPLTNIVTLYPNMPMKKTFAESVVLGNEAYVCDGYVEGYAEVGGYSKPSTAKYTHYDNSSTFIFDGNTESWRLFQTLDNVGTLDTYYYQTLLGYCYGSLNAVNGVIVRFGGMSIEYNNTIYPRGQIVRYYNDTNSFKNSASTYKTNIETLITRYYTTSFVLDGDMYICGGEGTSRDVIKYTLNEAIPNIYARYTIDKSVPSDTSPIYTTPLDFVTGNVYINAISASSEFNLRTSVASSIIRHYADLTPSFEYTDLGITDKVIEDVKIHTEANRYLNGCSGVGGEFSTWMSDNNTHARSAILGNKVYLYYYAGRRLWNSNLKKFVFPFYSHDLITHEEIQLSGPEDMHNGYNGEGFTIGDKIYFPTTSSSYSNYVYDRYYAPETLVKIHVYDTKTDTWEYIVSSELTFVTKLTVVIGNLAYMICPHAGGGALYTYDPIKDKLTKTNVTVPRATELSGICVYKNNIYVVGGRPNEHTYGYSSEWYFAMNLDIIDTTNMTLKKGADIPHTRGGHVAMCFNKKIYLIDGDTGGTYWGENSKQLNIYDITTDTWTIQGSYYSGTLAIGATGRCNLQGDFVTVGGTNWYSHSSTPTDYMRYSNYDINYDIWYTTNGNDPIDANGVLDKYAIKYQGNLNIRKSAARDVTVKAVSILR